MRKYSLNENVFENIDNEEKAYWLGFILSDGSINISKKNQHTIKLALSSIDITHLQKFKNFVQTDMPIKEYLAGNSANNKKSKICEICITSKKIVKDLQNLGIGPRKSFTVKVPNIREDLKVHLFRGIWDGDGSVLYRKSRTTDSNTRPEVQLCGNLEVLKYIQDVLVNHLDILPNSICKCRSIFLFRYTGFAGYKIAKYLYNNSNIYLDRKYEKYLLIKKWKPLINYPKNVKFSNKGAT